MSSIQQFLREIQHLSAAEQSLLRQASGSLLSRNVPAFDLFTGIYWRLDRRGLDKRRLWLAATLYPWNSVPDGKGCFGAAWARACPRGDEARRRHDLRLEEILSAEPPVLGHLLLDALRTLARNNIGVDWERLTEDLHGWGDARTRQCWAEAYLRENQQGDSHAH